MAFHRFLLVLLAASFLISETLASSLCPSDGPDAFYAYVRLDVTTKGTKALDDNALSTHFSQTFNQLASLACDFDHRRIRSSEVDKSMSEDDSNGEMKQSIQIKAWVQYKGRSTPGLTRPPPSTKIPSLFGPETFQETYVEEACACEASTGVDSAAFQAAFETVLTGAADGGSVQVTHMEELAVSAV